LREDLRIVVMSATLDGERLARSWMRRACPAKAAAIRSTIAHFPARREEALEAQARRAAEQAPGPRIRAMSWCSCPGQREIARAARRWRRPRQLRRRGAALHGELPVEAAVTRAAAAIRWPPPHRAGDQCRRIVGDLARRARGDRQRPGARAALRSQQRLLAAGRGADFAQASADQRAGRAGRVAEGWAYRLWPQSQRLEPQRRPEIAQVELAGLALELAAWGSAACASSIRRRPARWPPRATCCSGSARSIRQRRDHRPGRRMLALGTHPRLAAMLLRRRSPREQALACDLAALVEARDPLRSRSDALAARWRRWPPSAVAACRPTPAARPVWRRSMRRRSSGVAAALRGHRRRGHAEAHELGDLLAHAFPDRIAPAASAADALRYQLANGRMVRACSTTARCAASRGWWPANCATRRAGCAAAARCTGRRARLRARFPAAFRRGAKVRGVGCRNAPCGACASRRFDRIVLDSQAGRPRRSGAGRATR
jgi:ATP-dependent helicase HrpB